MSKTRPNAPTDAVFTLVRWTYTGGDADGGLKRYEVVTRTASRLDYLDTRACAKSASTEQGLYDGLTDAGAELPYPITEAWVDAARRRYAAWLAATPAR